MHVVDAPGASVAASQAGAGAGPEPEKAETAAVVAVRVTLPRLVTMKVYATWSPTSAITVRSAWARSVTAGAASIGTSTGAGGAATWPPGAAAVAVTVLRTEPASTSACVRTYAVVQVTVAPGATWSEGQTTASPGPAGAVKALATASPDSVWLPVLVTSTVYAIR